jgi:ATP-dependent protease HslVU (ClpYQ) peptidase subunit
MTCIVGLRTSNITILSADSMGSGELVSERYTTEKIFKLVDSRNTTMLVGFQGSYRIGDIIKYCLDIPDIPKRNINKYMVREFIPSLITALDEGGCLLQQEDKGIKGGECIIGVRDKLFLIQDDFSVLEPQAKFTSIGSGFTYALGSLHTTTNMILSPQHRVELALNAASIYSPTVGGDTITIVEALN